MAVQFCELRARPAMDILYLDGQICPSTHHRGWAQLEPLVMARFPIREAFGPGLKGSGLGFWQGVAQASSATFWGAGLFSASGLRVESQVSRVSGKCPVFL